MADFNLVMPKLGESVQEATIIKWFKKEGDTIEEDEPILEIATDKVDSEIPSPVEGVITKILYKVDDVVAVDEVIATINLEGDTSAVEKKDKEEKEGKIEEKNEEKVEKQEGNTGDYKKSGRFYSPLVQSIAKKENISPEELDGIKGTGKDGRVRKQDVLAYLENRGTSKAPAPAKKPRPEVVTEAGDEIIKMDRMRKLIADHMVMSKQVSPHVTNFIEVDVTNIVKWRDKIKDKFYAQEKQKITYLPIFLELLAKALKEYPGINASVDGDNIILRKNINLGIAVALPNNNLIVPVIKNADQKSLTGLTVELNKLAENARTNKLNPDDIQGGTFSISNFGSFRNVTGTPIINQPQVAILAIGTIEKKPAVLETSTGDVIAIRHKMFLALTYDHRVVDGAMAGSFLRRLADLMEAFDINKTL